METIKIQACVLLMKHHVNEAELLAKCQPLFPDRLPSLLVHLTITQAKTHAPPSSALLLHKLPCLQFLPWEFGHLVGMPNQVNTTQQASAPIASIALRGSLVCTNLPSNSPVLPKAPSSKFPFPKEPLSVMQ